MISTNVTPLASLTPELRAFVPEGDKKEQILDKLTVAWEAFLQKSTDSFDPWKRHHYGWIRDVHDPVPLKLGIWQDGRVRGTLVLESDDANALFQQSLQMRQAARDAQKRAYTLSWEQFQKDPWTFLSGVFTDHVVGPWIDFSTTARNSLTAACPSLSANPWISGMGLLDGIGITWLGMMKMRNMLSQIGLQRAQGVSWADISKYALADLSIGILYVLTGLSMMCWRLCLLVGRRVASPVLVMGLLLVLCVASFLANAVFMVKSTYLFYRAQQLHAELSGRLQQDDQIEESWERIVHIATVDPKSRSNETLYERHFLSEELIDRIVGAKEEERAEILREVLHSIREQQVTAALIFSITTVGCVAGALSSLCPILSSISGFAWLAVSAKVVTVSSYFFATGLAGWLFTDLECLATWTRTQIIHHLGMDIPPPAVAPFEEASV